MSNKSIEKKRESLKEEFDLIVEAAKQLKIDQQKDAINLQALQAIYKELETLTVNEEISQNEAVINIIQGRMEELKTEFDDTKVRLSEYATKGQQYSTEMRSLQRSYKDLGDLLEEPKEEAPKAETPKEE